jgi:hypothetical protein
MYKPKHTLKVSEKRRFLKPIATILALALATQLSFPIIGSASEGYIGTAVAENAVNAETGTPAIPDRPNIISVTYPQGWNMIAAADVVIDADVRQNFFIYDSQRARYTPADTTVAGQGYWAYFTKDITLTMAINNSPRFPVRLSAGWNMVGNPFGSDTTVPLGYEAYIYKPSTNSYQATDVIPKGYSVWLYTNTTTSIELENKDVAKPIDVVTDPVGDDTVADGAISNDGGVTGDTGAGQTASDSTNTNNSTGDNQTMTGSTISVAEYGAKGDGITDDTRAIQSAIDALPTDGTLVGEADKWYLVSSIYLKSNMTLANIKLLAKPTHETNILQSVVNIGKWYEKILKKNIIIRDIEVNGQRSKFTNIPADEDGGKHGIKVVGRAENITIERVKAHHCATDGLMIHQGVGNIPEGYDATEPLVTNIVVRDSEFNYNRRCGISAQSLNGALFDRVITNYNDTDIDQTEGGKGITYGWVPGGNRFAQGMDIESDGKPGQQSKNVTVQNSESRGNATQGFCVSEHLPPSDANYRPHENIKFIGNVADSGNVPGRDLFGIIIFNDKRTDQKKGYSNIVIRDNKLNDGGVALISVDGAIVANNEMKVSDGTALFADYTNGVTFSNNISNGLPVFAHSTNHTTQ